MNLSTKEASKKKDPSKSSSEENYIIKLRLNQYWKLTTQTLVQQEKKYKYNNYIDYIDYSSIQFNRMLWFILLI